MKIQVITNQRRSRLSGENITTRSFGSADALDAYDIAIIDLQDQSIWRNVGTTFDHINHETDFISIREMLCHSKTCKTLVLLPQNYTFEYSYEESFSEGEYVHSTPIKNIISRLMPVLRILVPDMFDMTYGHAETHVGNLRLESDFSLVVHADAQPVKALSSEAGGITGVLLNDTMGVTTMDIRNESQFLVVCKKLGMIGCQEQPLPDWLSAVSFLDERDVRNNLANTENDIRELKQRRDELVERLDSYAEMKSILCSKDERLQRVVVEILASLLDASSDFEDMREEDFRYVTSDGRTLVFEIKGSVGSLKRQHVSRTNDHVQIVADEIEAEGENADPVV